MALFVEREPADEEGALRLDGQSGDERLEVRPRVGQLRDDLIVADLDPHIREIGEGEYRQLAADG